MTTSNHYNEHDAEAVQTACELVWALRATYPTTAAEYRERAAVLTRLLNSAAMITQTGGGSAYEYAAELITEATESHTDTGDDTADAAALDSAITAAERTLYDAADEARKRDEEAALNLANHP